MTGVGVTQKVLRPEGRGAASEHLVDACRQLSLSRDLAGVMQVVRRVARKLAGADGATFVLREGNLCHYAEEDAIGPLWKGRRFPIHTCISGWAMLNRQQVTIEDIYDDERIPVDAYRPTFVKSLAIVPIRTAEPVGAIGTYWSSHHRATPDELRHLQVLADMTSVAMENVQLYASLQRKVAQLERLVQGRDDFISAVAHELRTPVAALQLRLQHLSTLLEREVGPGPAATSLERLCEVGERLESLVEAVLDGARVVERVKLRHRRVDFCDIVKRGCASTDASARRAGCRLTLVAQGEASGHWDSEWLELAVTHLLSNAIKYGAGKPIEVTVSSTGEHVRLQVRDHGPGVETADLERIFEPFERASSLRNYGGLGRGLHFVRRIALDHGGCAWAERPADDGLAVVVELPRGAEVGNFPGAIA